MTNDTLSSVQLEVLSLDPLSAAIPLEDWQTLCAAALSPNPFFGPDFLCPFLEKMSKQAVRLVVVREQPGGRWLVAAPVGRRRFGLAVAVNTTWATEYAPLGTPLIHPDASAEAIATFINAAREPGNALAIPYLPLHSQSATRLRAVGAGKKSVLAKSFRASHGAGATGKSQLAEADSGKRRKEMRRLMRRLGDHGKTSFSSLSGSDAIAGFEAFLELEASGWKGRSGTALGSQSGTADFARTAVANLASRNGVRIDQLWSGQTLVATLVLFQQSGKVYSWKIAFDEEFARYSPGAQIALQALKINLAIPGFRGADSLAIPGHSMIEPLWRGRLETGTMLFADGLKRSLCKTDLKLEQALRRAARALKKRLRS
ncbi:GNAT family N-acetyltransferase [uncultured Roseibium sp.]|uniref:GNAT family N-acetyltransferase n=1 Tax=uncultured Roseibium sp. TaxID=1936171 RepID=UPI00260BA4CE|nr:GNAT family N-acetyltransferase [uncultured Roseibium sp.]